MPDFLFQRGEIPFGWAEAKDIDKDVIKLKGYSKGQRKRYEAAYPNLIYTNGVDFEFIRDGESIHFVSIADFLMGLQPNLERTHLGTVYIAPFRSGSFVHLVNCHRNPRSPKSPTDIETDAMPLLVTVKTEFVPSVTGPLLETVKLTPPPPPPRPLVVLFVRLSALSIV
jgi:hypothetical protein